MSEDRDSVRLDRTERLALANRKNLQLLQVRPQPPRSVRRNDNGFITWDAPNEMRNVTHFNVYVDTDKTLYARLPSDQVRMEGVFKDRVWVSSYNHTVRSESRRVMAEDSAITPNQQRLWLEIGGVTVRITSDLLAHGAYPGMFIYNTADESAAVELAPGLIMISDQINAGMRFLVAALPAQDADMVLYDQDGAEKFRVKAQTNAATLSVSPGIIQILESAGGALRLLMSAFDGQDTDFVIYDDNGVEKFRVKATGTDVQLTVTDGTDSTILKQNEITTTGTLDVAGDGAIHGGASLGSLGVGVAAPGTAGYAKVDARLGVNIDPTKAFEVDGDADIHGAVSLGALGVGYASPGTAGYLKSDNIGIGTAPNASYSLDAVGALNAVGLDVGGIPVVGSRKTAVTTISATAGATYTGTEQAMLNAIKASLNDLIAKLSSSSGHGLLT